MERTCLFLIGIVMTFLFARMFYVLKGDFSEVDSRMANGTMINLNDDKPAERMTEVLEKGMYFEDPKDISFIATRVAAARKPGTEIDNVGTLNKAAYYVNADQAFSEGGVSFKKRAEMSRDLLGFSKEDSTSFKSESIHPMTVPSRTDAGMGNGVISGTIRDNAGLRVQGALMRLRLLVPQVNSNATGNDNNIVIFKNGIRRVLYRDSSGKTQLLSFNAYARTDASGNFHFSGLPENNSYDLIPLQPGYEFGPSKGVEKLRGSRDFHFIRSPHTIKLFSTQDFNNLKKEKAFIVRTPEQVIYWFRVIVITFFVSFLLLHMLLTIRSPDADQLLLPVVMILTGLSFIALFSLQDPLRDRFLVKSTFIYFCIGICAVAAFQLVNLRRFTPDSGFFRLLMFKKIRTAANGWPWAIAAMGLLCLDYFFGTGPQGSGVKVNLFGFQPSEVVKYMVILFLAGFFAVNEKFISEYPSFKKRLSFFLFSVVAIVGTILLFLIIGDLGPAIICCFTFIILFSFSRGDFPEVVGTLLLYALSIWILKNVWTGTAVTGGALILFMLVGRRRLSESSVMALVVVAGFLLLDQVPVLAKVIPGPIHRLVDRKAIWSDPWNNQVYGGDQVANGIWAIATGGVTGQGAGKGFGKTIPEAHTDMILPAIGEEFGWVGIVCIFILFLVLLHRSMIIGRQAGPPFLFYLSAGVGIALFVQFLLIAGGSTGALPLSGVALPFTSYGGTSLLCSMVAIGFLLSVSRLKGTRAQLSYIANRQDKNLVPALFSACAAIVLLIINVSGYTLHRKKWIVEPALVADRSGVRMYSYNPRISILMNRLQAGNIYDRSGRLLASSNLNLVLRQKDSLLALGIPEEDLNSLSYKRQDRYYPFGKYMFFWTGDANTGVFSGGNNGYFAEYAHAAELRGFPAPVAKFEVSADRYREEKFLPVSGTEMTVVKRDFSAVADLLASGINSDAVAKFKKRNRDITLSMDAALQTQIELALQHDDSVNGKEVSVVIMKDNTGDVLASACWPLPPVDDWDKLTLPSDALDKLPGWNVNSDIGFTHATQPGSTAKLVTALAAFNKLGIAAAKKTIRVYPKDLIRINGPEPDEAGLINIEKAIVRSNNSFFIRLANEDQLQEQMVNLYMQSGMFLRGVGGYYFENDNNNTAQQEKWRKFWRQTEFKSLQRYDPNNIRRTRALGISGMAWGQGELVATPASVARIAAGIGNNGVMMPSRYVLDINGHPAKPQTGIAIAGDSSYAQYLATYMREQSAPKKPQFGIFVAGKTGTPERIVKGESINDGWYVFFAPAADGTGHIVACIRIEGTRGSADAMALAGAHIIPLLLKNNYIKSFDPLKKTASPAVNNNELTLETAHELH